MTNKTTNKMTNKVTSKMTSKAAGKMANKMVNKKTSKKAVKSSAPKTAMKKVAPKKAAAKKATKREPNAAFMRAWTPSTALAAVVGASPISRPEVVKKMWAYIHKNGLQDSQNRRNINADDKLKPIFGKGTVSMFEMAKLLSKHLK